MFSFFSIGECLHTNKCNGWDQCLSNSVYFQVLFFHAWSYIQEHFHHWHASEPILKIKVEKATIQICFIHSSYFTPVKYNRDGEGAGGMGVELKNIWCGVINFGKIFLQIWVLFEDPVKNFKSDIFPPFLNIFLRVAYKEIFRIWVAFKLHHTPPPYPPCSIVVWWQQCE